MHLNFLYSGYGWRQWRHSWWRWVNKWILTFLRCWPDIFEFTSIAHLPFVVQRVKKRQSYFSLSQIFGSISLKNFNLTRSFPEDWIDVAVRKVKMCSCYLQRIPMMIMTESPMKKTTTMMTTINTMRCKCRSKSINSLSLLLFVRMSFELHRKNAQM